MESILQVLPVKPERPSHAVTSPRDQEVEKCHLASRDPPSSSALDRTVETVETVENSERGYNVDYAESVASECSVESNASSNAPDGDCGESDADSPSQEEKTMKRCPSGGSIVTYDEAASKLREEGDCERTVDRKTARGSEGSQSNGLDDEQETSINAGQKMAESNGPAWTDDKHCSYLNSIEQTFVQSLYGQDYHTVDASGEDDPDCVESRPMYGNPYGCELFTSLQRGCYDQGEYYRPQFLHAFCPSTSAVFLSPWIQHFNPRAAAPSHGSTGVGQEAENGNPSAGLVDGAYGAGNFANCDVKEVKESIANLNSNPETGFQFPLSWSSRYQSQHIRVDTGMQAKKRNCNLDSVNDATYRPKKLKSTQRLLAEIDLEMEEQFVLKQKHLKELAEFSDLREEPQPLGGLDLNKELVDDDESKPEETRAVTKTTDFVSYFGELNKASASEVAVGKRLFEPKLHQATGDFGEGSSGVNKVVDATGCDTPPGKSLKLGQDEPYCNHEGDPGLDEEEEFEFLLRRSPRASKTYTWGGTIGPRRRLHSECNVLVEPAALSGSVKDSREHELPNKGNSEWK